ANTEGTEMAKTLFVSNEPLYVEHFNCLFEELWKNGVEAAERIKDIESGADLAYIQVVPNASRARELYLTLINSAAKEILLVFPTTGAFVRQEKMGVIQSCKEPAKEHNVYVRILMPADKSTEQTVQN